MLPLVAFAVVAFGACGTKTETSQNSTAPAGSGARAAVVGVVDAGAASAATKAVEYGENDFVESDRNRDPFRSFATAFADQGKKPVLNQRAVLLSQYAIEELKLVAIQTGGDFPRAMVVDPTGRGWVVKRGDFIGRPDVVHTGGTNGADYQLNWRVERVRDGDLVLTREDPAQPGIPPATRVIPIRQEQADNTARLSPR
jgi:type IV pilus assembly protein PilP